MDGRKKIILFKIPIQEYRILNKKVNKIKKGENTSENVTSYLNRLIYQDNHKEENNENKK